MDVVTVLRQMQLEKVKGELRVLRSIYYDPMNNKNNFKEVKKVVEEIINTLDNELG